MRRCRTRSCARARIRACLRTDRNFKFTALAQLRGERRNAYIPATSVIPDDIQLRLRGRTKPRGDLANGGSTADAESDSRLAGREHRALVRSGGRILQAPPA